MISPPEPEEIEVSVFGRGYGESILIHATQNNWFIVDSCINPSTERPASLEYLDKIGIDPALAVKQIIATHWHDDHIRGLGDVYKACTSAEFVCSVALNFPEFITLVQTYENNIMAKDTGIDEFKTIVNELLHRKKKPVFAMANTPLWRKEIKDNNGNEKECCIYSLSPSNHAITAAMIDIQRNQATKKDAKKRVIATSPNHAAVVLWISIGDFNILLGSDLENTRNTDSGWSAIVNSTLRPQGRAKYFKIPHHGSQNAHSLEVWQHMMDTDHVSILTPFHKLLLPTRSDVDRICSLSERSFSTSSLKQKKVKRDKSVEKMIKDTVKNIRLANPSFGQVRQRVSSNGSSIDLFLDATSLKQIYD
ncbi:hypothetical protein BMS3Abin06_01442 [bacterium BMS3Abin06]|nr:hypothetical protein BMS3Abin06_01442 [bacterium BMS3Abin06]HDZ01572.1 MBL fold metallo-hydrolase [Nitrospirota bacterium]